MSIFVSFSMYYLSFVPLWIAVVFIDIKSLCEGGSNKNTEIISLCTIVVLTIITLFILLGKLYVTKDERYVYQVMTATESKTVTAEFLLSYILPLFAFDFTLWDEVVKFLIFFLIFGVLCIRHNYFSANIILEAMKYKLYDCKLENSDGEDLDKIVISRKNLTMRKGHNIEVKVINNEYLFDPERLK